MLVKKKNLKTEPWDAFTLELGEMKRNNQKDWEGMTREMGGKPGACRALELTCGMSSRKSISNCVPYGIHCCC